MLLDFERPRSSSKCKKYIIRWICRILPYDQIKTMKKLNSKSASFINFPFWFDCTMMFDIWNFTYYKLPVLCLIFGICAIFEWRLRSGLRRYEGFQHFEIDSHTKKNRNSITFRFSWLCYTETMPYVSLNIPFSWIFTLGWNLKKYAVLCSGFEKNLRTVPVYFFLPRLLHFFLFVYMFYANFCFVLLLLFPFIRLSSVWIWVALNRLSIHVRATYVQILQWCCWPCPSISNIPRKTIAQNKVRCNTNRVRAQTKSETGKTKSKWCMKSAKYEYWFLVSRALWFCARSSNQFLKMKNGWVCFYCDSLNRVKMEQFWARHIQQQSRVRSFESPTVIIDINIDQSKIRLSNFTTPLDHIQLLC